MFWFLFFLFITGLVPIFCLGFIFGKRYIKQEREEGIKAYEIHVGERIVNEAIESNLNESEFHLLKNITISDGKGTTQIDQVVVSRKGIFVLETKHYTGWIFGSERSGTWTQTTKKGKKSYFQSPIRQNYKHVQVLRSLFPDIKEEAFKSVVVFSGDAVFKTDMPENVLKVNYLETYLLNFEEDLLTEEQCCWVIGCIQFKRKLVSTDTDAKHRRHLEKKFG